MHVKYLFEYSRVVRRRFAEKLSQLPWDDVIKNREASYYSMKNILLHLIDNEDWIVNYAIFGKTKEYSRKKSEEYTDMQMILDHLGRVELRSIKFFSGITDAELKKQIAFEIPSSGKKFDLTIEECLIQSFTEQLYHLGEIICLLWQEDIEPPPMQWFYNRPKLELQN